MNPSLGRNFEAMGPLEWLARMSDHIPDPGQHARELLEQKWEKMTKAKLPEPSKLLTEARRLG
jgi:hypothetical protein